MSIRKMTVKDIDAVAALEKACFKHPWPKKDVAYEIRENPVSFEYVAEIDGKIVGYIDFMITFTSATVNRICTRKEYRRQGIAQALIEKMVKVVERQEEHVDFITLEVRSSNKAAISLYEKNHFSKVLVKKAYYSDGEDAIYMVRSFVQ
jgi:ribosomal-protein-alanine N-acetyltransferase